MPLKRVASMTRKGKWKALAKPENDKHETTERKCLRCKEPFQSWGPGNRLCELCRDVARRLRGIDV